MEYLVESHLGGYYITYNDNIDLYCETCGDYDNIITSWEEYNKYNTLLNLIVTSYYLDIDSLKEYMEDLYENYPDNGITGFLEDYKYIRECHKNYNEDFVRVLHEEDIINERESINLLSNNTKTFHKEIKLAENIDLTYLKPKVKKYRGRI